MERGYGDFEGITKVELKEMKKKDSRIDEACNYIKNVSIYNMETMQTIFNKKKSFIKTTDLLCLKGKLHNFHLTIIDEKNKVLNNNEFLLVLSVI